MAEIVAEACAFLKAHLSNNWKFYKSAKLVIVSNNQNNDINVVYVTEFSGGRGIAHQADT